MPLCNKNLRLDILLIEDDHNHIALVNRHLNSKLKDRFTLTTCHTLSDGISKLESSEPDAYDVIILDLTLPDSPPEQTFNAIKSRTASVPLIVYSSLEDYDFAKKLVRNGCDDFLCKSDLNAELLIRSIYYSKERKKLKLELEAKLEQLNQLNSRKDEFLATLSHELRNPLNIIVGSVELLKMFPSDSSEFKKALEDISNSARMEAQMIDEMLEASRIVTNKFKITKNWFSITKLVESAIQSQAMSAKTKSISISSRIQAYRPDCFYGDYSKLHQALSNLISNAIKFTPDEGKVLVDIKRDKKNLTISVRDNGKGIAESDLPYLFDKFWQADSSQRKKQAGLGLGLSIVDEIVRLHSGEIKAESEGLNKGTEFTITLPIDRSAGTSLIGERQILARDNFEKASRAANASLHENSLSNKRILAVDDDESSKMIIKCLLELAGAKVTVAGGAKEALEKVKENKFDCIISDIGMPEIDGFEFMSRLRKWEDEEHIEHIPAMALTGYSNKEEVEKAKKYGYNQHHAKPLYKDKLIASVQGLIQNA